MKTNKMGRGATTSKTTWQKQRSCQKGRHSGPKSAVGVVHRRRGRVGCRSRRQPANEEALSSSPRFHRVQGAANSGDEAPVAEQCRAAPRGPRSVSRTPTACSFPPDPAHRTPTPAHFTLINRPFSPFPPLHSRLTRQLPYSPTGEPSVPDLYPRVPALDFTPID